MIIKTFIHHLYRYFPNAKYCEYNDLQIKKLKTHDFEYIIVPYKKAGSVEISEPIKLSDCGTDKLFKISRYHEDGQCLPWTIKIPALPEGHDWGYGVPS